MEFAPSMKVTEKSVRLQRDQLSDGWEDIKSVLSGATNQSSDQAQRLSMGQESHILSVWEEVACFLACFLLLCLMQEFKTMLPLPLFAKLSNGSAHVFHGLLRYLGPLSTSFPLQLVYFPKETHKGSHGT